MRKQKNLLSVAVASLLAILSIGSAHAAAIWNSNGGGCVPEDPAIEQNIHFTVTGGMRVKFRTGKTGTIKLVCPVTVSFKRSVGPIGAGENFVALAVYYQDPDGSGGDYQVEAHLRSVRLSDGAISTVCTADSNSAGSSAQWSKMTCRPKLHLGSGHVYWVQIEIKRQATSKTVEINAVELVTVVG